MYKTIKQSPFPFSVIDQQKNCLSGKKSLGENRRSKVCQDSDPQIHLNTHGSHETFHTIADVSKEKR